MDTRVEIGRSRIIRIGAGKRPSQYVNIPQTLRRKLQSELNDEIIFYQSAESGDVIIQIEKKPKT